MFIVGHVAKLVAYYPGVAYRGVNVGMRVTINPCIYSAVGNIITQFSGKGPV